VVVNMASAKRRVTTLLDDTSSEEESAAALPPAAATLASTPAPTLCAHPDRCYPKKKVKEMLRALQMKKWIT
jgi:hypothetical protein